MIAVSGHQIPGSEPVDHKAVVADLRRRFPGVQIWYGDSTRSYWAMVAEQLYEATSPSGLHLILDSVAPTRRGP